MSTHPRFCSLLENLPNVERLAISRHALLTIEARRMREILTWLIPMGEAAFAVSKPSASDRDYELDLRDAIELAWAELPNIGGDPYFARWGGDVAIERLAGRIANVIGESPASGWNSEYLWSLARKVLK